MNGIRVVNTDGSPVGFLTSAVRNVMRIIDILPTAYLVGIVSILVSSRNQRLGDHAAGTLVVRDRFAVTGPGVDTATPSPPRELAAWDVSGVSTEELIAVRRFLERRHDLTPEARTSLGGDLASALRPKVAGVPDTVQGEAFLEHLAAAKQARMA
jgi:hypothetical protein